MLKKGKFLCAILATSFFAASAHAITIINENGKSVKYVIADSSACAVNYTSGELSPSGQVSWTGNVFYHPSKVCVHAMGWTSSVGDYAYSVNNDNCVLKVKDAGFMRGIKIEQMSGC